MSLFDGCDRVIIDGYELAAEGSAGQFPDVVRGGRTRNRASLALEGAGKPLAPGTERLGPFLVSPDAVLLEGSAPLLGDAPALTDEQVIFLAGQAFPEAGRFQSLGRATAAAAFDQALERMQAGTEAGSPGAPLSVGCDARCSRPLRINDPDFALEAPEGEPAQAVFLGVPSLGQALTLPRAEWLVAVEKECRSRGVGLVLDERETFLRTGRRFLMEGSVTRPDLLLVGLAPDEVVILARTSDAPGADSKETATVAQLDEGPTGRTLLQNWLVKGEYLRLGLSWLQACHEEALLSFCGRGGLFALQVVEPDALIDAAANHCLRLEKRWARPDGGSGEIVLRLCGDVLTREVDLLVEALGRALAERE